MSAANADAGGQEGSGGTAHRIFSLASIVGWRTHFARSGTFLAFRAGVSIYPIVARGVALAALVLAMVNLRGFQNDQRFGCGIGSRPFAQRGTRRSR